MSALRQAGLSLHRCFAWHPDLAKSYLTAWAWLLGLFRDGNRLKRRIAGNLRVAHWPPLEFEPRRIELAAGIHALITPMPCSLSFRSLYERRLGHEPGVPDFLAGRMQRYDAVLEIGANVGVYTLLFSKSLSPFHREGARVFSFEPSRKAFTCLMEHLELNGCHNVAAFNCAVGANAGITDFYENSLDLMKGSTDAEAAAVFAGRDSRPTPVVTISGKEIAPLLQAFSRILFKIDVVGSEPAVLIGLQDLVISTRPDLVLGVWSRNLAGLNRIPFLFEQFTLARIDQHGLAPRDSFTDETYCNYFLEPRKH